MPCQRRRLANRSPHATRPHKISAASSSKGANQARTIRPIQILASDADPAAKPFSAGEDGSLRSRWESIQVEFVGEPKRSVKESDQLVAAVIGHFAEGFRTERQGIEPQWDRSDDISTEDPGCSFRRHRSTFERLLSI